MVRCSVSSSECHYAAINTTDANFDSSSFVFSSVGYGAGVAPYLIFGVFATFSGWAIWKVYLDLDSSRYPMMSYGDPFFRLFGKRSRHFINVAQSLQQFLTVAVLILSKTTNIAQISKGHVCFSAIMVIVLGIGMLSGIIRSLKKIGWLSNAAVFMNIANFLIIVSIIKLLNRGITANFVTRWLRPHHTSLCTKPSRGRHSSRPSSRSLCSPASLRTSTSSKFLALPRNSTPSTPWFVSIIKQFDHVIAH